MTLPHVGSVQQRELILCVAGVLWRTSVLGALSVRTALNQGDGSQALTSVYLCHCLSLTDHSGLSHHCENSYNHMHAMTYVAILLDGLRLISERFCCQPVSHVKVELKSKLSYHITCDICILNTVCWPPPSLRGGTFPATPLTLQAETAGPNTSNHNIVAYTNAVSHNSQMLSTRNSTLTPL